MIKMADIKITDLINPDSKFSDEITSEQLSDVITSGVKKVHKNARHDAVDKMIEIREKWSKTHNFSQCDAMLDEITGAIMNLQIRYE